MRLALKGFINQWFPLIRPYYTLISEGGTLGGSGWLAIVFEIARNHNTNSKDTPRHQISVLHYAILLWHIAFGIILKSSSPAWRLVVRKGNPFFGGKWRGMDGKSTIENMYM